MKAKLPARSLNVIGTYSVRQLSVSQYPALYRFRVSLLPDTGQKLWIFYTSLHCRPRWQRSRWNFASTFNLK